MLAEPASAAGRNRARGGCRRSSGRVEQRQAVLRPCRRRAPRAAHSASRRSRPSERKASASASRSIAAAGQAGAQPEVADGIVARATRRHRGRRASSSRKPLIWRKPRRTAWVERMSSRISAWAGWRRALDALEGRRSILRGSGLRARAVSDEERGLCLRPPCPASPGSRFFHSDLRLSQKPGARS